MSTPEPLQLAPPRGRPLLHWVGKRPPGSVHYYPAQITEACQVQNPPAQPSWEALQHNWCNLLFHGDNKEILSTLIVNGLRGQVELIYIDPPFDSGANYVRKVALRGRKAQVLEGQGYSLGEDLQYEDIWANDTYLQYMYERLILLRELLSERGSIYLHCDWHKAHHLRFLMDEIFGPANCVNEIAWCYVGAGQAKSSFNRKHDTILFYRKTDSAVFNWQDVSIKYDTLPLTAQWRKGHTDRAAAEARAKQKMEEGKMQYDWWQDIPAYATATRSPERTDFPTQKPVKLLERIIKASSNPGALVLDCFCGSGTTAAVAQKLGRRWIAADMNSGAIHTTAKRLRSLLAEQAGQAALGEGRQAGFATYRVNNYDFKQQHALRARIEAKYGVERIPSEFFFDGQVNGRLVKIAELNRPLTPQDVLALKEELDSRPQEARAILLIGNGALPAFYQALAEHNRLAALNKITALDVQAQGLLEFRPGEAEVEFTRQGDSMQVVLKNYLSPSILGRLELERSVFGEEIDDFRAQIDCVLLDADYDGRVFRVCQSDLPEKQNGLVRGSYHVKLPRPQARVALKVIDMLGEEVLQVAGKP